ncbi:MAG: hypothetical protein IJF67_17020 [Clostridia bacterium]|nr:hypothetical protein [Clostridia bacterium]
MRRIGSIALAALLIAAMGTTATAAQKTYKAASGTPTIDGKLDDAYKAAQAIAINVHTSGAKTTEGTAYCLWDANNVYVYFDVTDPAISEKKGQYMYEADSVEWFLDLTGKTNADITKVNAGQYTAPAPVPGQALTEWAGRGGHWDKNKAASKYSSVKTDKGYAIEMQIAWGADYTPKANAEILTAFHINADDDGKSKRDGEVFGNEGQSKAWSESLAYDKLVLTDAVYKPPVKEAAKTADAGIIAALAALASSGAAALSLKKRK